MRENVQPGVTGCKRGKTFNRCLTREKMQPVISAGKLVTKHGKTSYAKSGLGLVLLVSDLFKVYLLFRYLSQCLHGFCELITSAVNANSEKARVLVERQLF